jgi:hypothetical protein
MTSENALRAASPEAVRLYRSLRAALRPMGLSVRK